MDSIAYKADKSTTINAPNIFRGVLVRGSQIPATMLYIKTAFYSRLIRNTKNTSFHELDCTSGCDTVIIVGENVCGISINTDTYDQASITPLMENRTIPPRV